jgi:hypothetical protein
MENKLVLLVVLILFLLSENFAQTVYEVTPGTKGNEITLTVANVSETNLATNVNIVLTRKSSALNFNKETETIEMIEAKAEAEALFTFDVNRNATVNKKDTIDFMITDANGLMMTKSFIFSYTGPKEFKLEQNFPNPFNPSTTISFSLPQSQNVELKVFDMLGNEVALLLDEYKSAGEHKIEFNGSELSTGIYFYQMKAGDFIKTKKLVLLK